MYRDDPLDDEEELRAILGNEAVEALVGARDDLAGDPVEVALDTLRVLQGWVEDDAAGRWFHRPQGRLDDRTPVVALVDGEFDEVLDAARAWAAANG
ncbi:MAG: hypothetical protein KY457_09680 [Actinobacteria bacterium]|nr:hypothetical protein [Actinomycetota bacterium]